jgi:putative photosynthetic complex assembly protein
VSGPIHFEPEPGARPDAAPITVPKPALYMAAAMIVFVIGLAASARIFGFGSEHDRGGTVLVERDLQFADAPDGGIIVTDATTKQASARIDPGTNGFVRGSLRALARGRTAAGIAHDVPFKLVRYTDGRLVLIDPSTKQSVTISSFGHTQVESFERLLK